MLSAVRPRPNETFSEAPRESPGSLRACAVFGNYKLSAARFRGGYKIIKPVGDIPVYAVRIKNSAYALIFYYLRKSAAVFFRNGRAHEVIYEIYIPAVEFG